jgi:hypothetical protein
MHNAGCQPGAQKNNRKMFGGLKTFTTFVAFYVIKIDIERMDILQNRMVPDEMYDEVLLSRMTQSVGREGYFFEYEAPRASVRGVFLCDGIADTAVSVLTAEITQEEWANTYTTIGTSVSNTEDIWIDL